MNIKPIFLLSLFSSAIYASIPSDAIYFGSRGIDNSCGSQGRMITISELKKSTDWCQRIGEYAIYKADGEDGRVWQVMGSGHGCDLKTGGNPDNASVCIKNSYLNEGLPKEAMYVAKTTNCGDNGRIMTVAELRKTTGWCERMGAWNIYRIKGGDGTDWQMMGPSHGCKIEQGTQAKVDQCVYRGYDTNPISKNDIYLGVSGMVNPCGSKGRMATVDELRRSKGWCERMGTKQINKANGQDGTLWQVTGRNHNCEIKPGGNPHSMTQCVTYQAVDGVTFSVKEKDNFRKVGPFAPSYEGERKIGDIFRDPENKDNPQFYILKTDNDSRGVAFSDRNHWLPMTVRTWQENSKGVSGELFYHRNLEAEDGNVEVWRVTLTGDLGPIPTDRESSNAWEYLGLY